MLLLKKWYKKVFNYLSLEVTSSATVFNKTNRNILFVNSKRFYNSNTNTDSHKSYERDQNEKNNIVPIHIISDEEYNDLMKKKDGEMEFIIDPKQIEMLKDLEKKSLNQIWFKPKKTVINYPLALFFLFVFYIFFFIIKWIIYKIVWFIFHILVVIHSYTVIKIITFLNEKYRWDALNG